jgi:L-ascorbate metabolism protein UlaG (beta-lactamase superfamily)
VIAPRGSGRYLERWAGVEVTEMREGDRVQLADVEITALPANHDSAYRGYRPEGCLGYVMRNRLSVYFAGDTDLFDGMDDVGQGFDLDLALLPVWGYSHRVGPGHLNPLTAAQALARLQPRIAVPIHWGTLRLPGPQALWRSAGHMSQPPHSFANYARSWAPETEVRVLQPGDWTSLN